MSTPIAITPERGWRPSLVRDLIRRVWSARPWKAAAYLLLNFLLGVIWFVVFVPLILLGLALWIIRIGNPILAMTLLLSSVAARFERWRVRAFFGEAIPSPYVPLPAGWRSTLRRARDRARDPAAKRDLIYLILLCPVGVAEFVLAFVAVVLPLSMIFAPVYFWSVPGGIDMGTWAVDTLPEAVILALIGLVIGLPAWLGLVWLARGHVALARWLLGPTNERLVERVEELTLSRSGVIEAQLQERRRIERDLHDGAQQRLVGLAMDLGMAKVKLKSDPEAARALIETSHEEAKRVLAELRDLVRGIHPAVLTDRGLDAAISAIAGRSQIPVTVDVRLAARPPEAIEAAAYFVVLEALTNVTKHSGATEARVAAWRDRDHLVVEVVDDGVGGAAAARGTGLAGLADRLAALDGRLIVDSPRGGPTRVRAEIPCAS